MTITINSRLADLNSKLLEYFANVKEGNRTTPSKETQEIIARKLDEAAKGSVVKLWDTLEASPEHKKRISILEKSPRTVGKYSRYKIILKDSSPFEQYFALSKYLQNHPNINQVHSYFFAAGQDDYIPVFVKTGSLMNTILGTTRGNHKAPTYKDWASNDPWTNTNQKRFIFPLESLEMVRQPDFMAATLLKSNAFFTDYIDTYWRYGKETACVEDPGQSRNSSKKIRSSGLNLTKMVKGPTEPEDIEDGMEHNICRKIKYEDYSEEGYQDDAEITVSPEDVLKAVETAIVSKKDQDLSDLMFKLAVGETNATNTDFLKSLVVKELFPKKSD